MLIPSPESLKSVTLLMTADALLVHHPFTSSGPSLCCHRGREENVIQRTINIGRHHRSIHTHSLSKGSSIAHGLSLTRAISSLEGSFVESLSIMYPVSDSSPFCQNLIHTLCVSTTTTTISPSQALRNLTLIKCSIDTHHIISTHTRTCSHRGAQKGAIRSSDASGCKFGALRCGASASEGGR